MDTPTQQEIIDGLTDEVERLRAEVAWWQEASDTGRVVRERDEARQEVERLKAIIDDCKGINEFYRERRAKEAALAEVERLRAAIREYLSEYDTPVPDLGLRVRYRERLKALTEGRK